MRTLGVLAVALFAVVATISIDAEEAELTRVILNRLAIEHGFEVHGIEILGNDLFTLSGTVNDVEREIARALARYNYVAQYSGQKISRLIILGRKGNDAGPMPETMMPDVVQPESGSDAPG